MLALGGPQKGGWWGVRRGRAECVGTRHQVSGRVGWPSPPGCGLCVSVTVSEVCDWDYDLGETSKLWGSAGSEEHGLECGGV